MVPTVLLMMAVLAILPPPSLAGLDNKGTKFVLGFMANAKGKGVASKDVQLFITTASETPATVRISNFPLMFYKIIKVTKGKVKIVNLNPKIRSSGILQSIKGIYIQANKEVSVYGVNLEWYSTEAYVALPVDVLGKEYYAVTYEKDAELMVIATEDGTDVSITLPKLAGKLVYQSVTYT
ncbi:IgGFc-binding protein-like [Babylonia areolata]|uniref:IgGFc-binding protein-like n=1 Tax=Babylonia areolata TaxID=304850 RepID=UPI003FD34C0F